ncbi:permease-like cell division protein FtsX [Buchananella hordeovulneris]|uniref:permease-like cell division protein FtsX n=1 Tax=Buchananella hordeovulneris TaxID=52770 RepID=UPI0026DD4B8E|nr:permease-like cell division protein FtsX [Buchananella hordeovulneris]MDO5080726.1 permease-like cell division protein FtsX [Buchananella hordeovulneris]
MRLQVLFSQVFQGLYRNSITAIGVMLVTAVSFVFLGSALLMDRQTEYMRESWYDKVEVTVYMCAAGDTADTCTAGEATQEQIDAIGEYLKSDAMKPYVADVIFEDKERAYANYQRMFSGTGLGQFADKELLPVSYRISLVDPREYQVVAEELTGRDGVYQVRDQRAVVDPLLRVLNTASTLSLSMAGLMFLATVLLIMTTIRLSAINREKEVEIMRLVGASRLFIQLPFVLEVAISALLGAALAATALVVTVKFFVASWLGGAFSTMRFVDVGDALQVTPVLFALALVLAIVGSVFSVKRAARV